MPNRRPCGACGKPGVVARGLCRSCYYGRKRRGEPLPPKVTFRFDEYVKMIVPDDNGCWPWPGYVSPGRYGMSGAHTPAHVASYRHYVGDVPEGMDVGHKCHDADKSCQDWRACTHRQCVNPDHLAVESRSDNLRARPYRQTHCKRGHSLDGPHVRIIPQSGGRQCMLCVAILNTERKAGLRPKRSRPSRAKQKPAD